MAVDPYLLGAVLQEQTPAGALVQESSASDANGAFRFPSPLTLGNRVVTTVKGLHNGAPFRVTLGRVVEAQEPLVVSPLTTLVSSGAYTPAQVADLLNAALSGAALGPNDVTANPMARALDGNVNAADRQLLAGNLAVGAALAILQGNAASTDLGALVTAVAPRIDAALRLTGSPTALASAAAAVADYVASSSTTVEEATAATGRVTDQLLAQLVQVAADGGCAAIVASGDTLAAGTNATTVAAHLAAGRAALAHGISSNATDDFLTAGNEFTAALILTATDTSVSAADKDQARFFGAVARLLSLGYPYSDAMDDGLNDLGDLLDAYGMGGTNAQRKSLDTFSFLDCEDVYRNSPGSPTPILVGQECTLKAIPEGAPRTKAVQEFAGGQLASALRSVIAMLGEVSATFATTLDVHAEGKPLDLDYSDVLFLKGYAQGALAMAELQLAYDLDAKAGDVLSVLGEGGYGGYGGYGGLASAVEISGGYGGADPGLAGLLKDNPNLLKLVNAPSLQPARSDALAGIATMLQALTAIEAETDDQSDDLIRMNGDKGQLGRLRDMLRQAQTAIGSSGDQTLSMGTADPADDVVVNADRFFAGVDLRAMLPSFTAGPDGDAPGLFPDKTFGGVLVKLPIDLNTDLDGDGVPDFIGPFSYFFPALLADTAWSSSSSSLMGEWQFQATGQAFSFTGIELGAVEGFTRTGTYAIDHDVLTITLNESTPRGVRVVRVRAGELTLDVFEGMMEFLDSSGMVIDMSYAGFRRRS